MRTSDFALLGLMLSMPTALASDPGDQNSIKNIVLGAATAVEEGENIFGMTCALCHGHEGTGGQGRPLTGRSFEPESWFNIISKGQIRGSKRMPPYENSLSEEQRWQLIAYLLSLNDQD